MEVVAAVETAEADAATDDDVAIAFEVAAVAAAAAAAAAATTFGADAATPVFDSAAI